MAGSDYENLPLYVRKRKDFIQDTLFLRFSQEKELIELETCTLLAKNKQEPHGLETPYSMNYYFRNHTTCLKLPKVRYGISNGTNGKIAYIYCIQNSEKQPQKQDGIKTYVSKREVFKNDIENKIKPINSGFKKYRNCEPKMVLSLALFIKQVHDMGIRELAAPDYIPVRYWIRYDENGKKIYKNELLDQIQSHTTDAFLRLFLRTEEQIQGVTITAYPDDIDSYLHIKLSNTLTTKNALISKVCNIEKIDNQLINNSPELLMKV